MTKRVNIMAALLVAFLATGFAPQMKNPLQNNNPIPVYDRTVYCYVFDTNNLYINISKPKRTLYVYENRCTGTTLIAAYPVCLGANSGDKERTGDCRTPESKNGQPFIIS